MKRVLILIMALSMMLSAAACGNDSEKSQEKDTSVIQENQKPDDSEPESSVSNQTENASSESADESDVSDEQAPNKFIVAEDDAIKEGTIELNYKKPADVAMGFIQALATNEYSVAVSALNTSNSPYVFAEDIIFGLPRSNYSEISDHAGVEVYLSVKNSEVNKSSGYATVTVDMIGNEDKILESYDVYLVLSNDNKWLVKDTAFYLEEYYVRTAGDVTLSIEDVVVGDEYHFGKSGYNSMMDLYKIPAIGKAEKKFSISCEKYETSVDGMPTYNTAKEPFGLSEILKDEKLAEVLNAVMTLWNSFYTDYVNGASIAEMTQYFDVSVDTEVIKTCCDGFKNLINSATTFTDKDHHITQIQLREGETCFYITDEVIVANIQYQLDWIWDWSMGGAESCRRKSHILLKETDDGYKIFCVSDGSLFSDSNGNDW